MMKRLVLSRMSLCFCGKLISMRHPRGEHCSVYVEPRLLSASELLDLPVEHVVLSLPQDDYGLAYKEAKQVYVNLG